ncbi:MAG: protein translocase subunit SecDF [Rikenellaceae bacterium]
MQNKGAIRFLAIMLAIACAFQLSFTFVTRSVQQKAAEISGGDPQKETEYLDSMKSEVVYNLGLLKYTYSEALEKEINLGLDLRGGMNVMLEIDVRDVIKALAGENGEKDPLFNQALANAKTAQGSSTQDFITLFELEYAKLNPSAKLASLFATYDLRDKIKPDFTNAQVIEVLRSESESAISNSFNVLSSRIDRFGVVQPNIQRLENAGRILIELPGVKDPERVRKLLQGTASLEFWTVYTGAELAQSFNQANQILAALSAPTQEETVATQEEVVAQEAAGDSTDVIAALEQTTAVDSLVSSSSNALYSFFQPMTQGPSVGLARSYDTVRVNEVLNMPQIKALFPRDIKFMWGIKGIDTGNTTFELYAIRGGATGKAPLDGSAIDDAVGQIGRTGSAAVVSMSMNAAGAKVWSRMTSENIGKPIAVVLDNYVYTAPNVNSEITDGSSEISGSFTLQEARDLANVLKSGKLPAPATIVQEAVVGPTLGQESIDSGMSSFIIAFVLVLIYMIFFYNTAGFVANIALITNVFFLFGVLVSFGAVLTLPGIAGIVLTLGMAVDANVIIYERIKEELRSGKAVSMSIADGFRNAYSAIIDGNVTTIITGIVLFIFGTGPVQGFATTLIIGLLTSLFCAIFITRLLFEGMLSKNRKIKFSNSLTEKFLEKSKIDFVGKRKVTYVISAILIVAVSASLLTRGLNYGVDFTGGRTYVVRFDQNVSDNQVREALENAFPTTGNERENSFEVKQYGTEDQFQKRIVTQYEYSNEDPDVTNQINIMLYQALAPLYASSISEADFTTTVSNPYGIISAEKVGPAIANDIKTDSLIAIFFSLLAIGGYIIARFKYWQYAIGGIAALLHDAIITIGMFSLLYSIMPFNLTVDQSFIAAILTIIGYSINDTVIIFDRIRENNFLYPRRSTKENMNNAINQTLARTVNTAVSTLVVLLAIFFFGGEVIRGFIFALLFGVLIGTFSSIFVATPVAYDLLERKNKKLQK